MRTEVTAGRAYRDRTWVESLAGLLPSKGALGWLRARARPALHRLLARGRPLRAVLPGGETILVSPRYGHMTWNPDEYAAFRAAVRPGAVVVDVGANVGAYTLLFAHWTGSNGHVFAFEPDPRAFDGLVAHIALNGLHDRVTPVHAAVTAGSDRRVQILCATSAGLARLARQGEPGQTVEVDAVSIDDFCQRRGLRPSVVKVDVEGAELDVFRGARQTIASAGSALALFVEMHPSIWSVSGTSVSDLQRECEALGLDAEALDGTGQDVWTLEGVCLRLRPRTRGPAPS